MRSARSSRRRSARAPAWTKRSTLEALDAKREETAGKVALAQRAVFDLEGQLAERRSALVEAECRVAHEALDDAISRRDRSRAVRDNS